MPIKAKKGQEGRMFVTIHDNLIDKFFSSLQINVERKIKTVQYKRIYKIKKNKQKKNSKSAIYLASNFECYGLKNEEKEIARKAINYLVATFDKVYIKVHPQDAALKNDLFFFYASFKKKNIHIISNSLTSNQAINKINPNLIVGTFSSSLFDAFVAGYTVIFLYQLLPKIKELEFYSLILKKYNYSELPDFNEIKKII